MITKIGVGLNTLLCVGRHVPARLPFLGRPASARIIMINGKFKYLESLLDTEIDVNLEKSCA